MPGLSLYLYFITIISFLWYLCMLVKCSTSELHPPESSVSYKTDGLSVVAPLYMPPAVPLGPGCSIFLPVLTTGNLQCFSLLSGCVLAAHYGLICIFLMADDAEPNGDLC